MSAEELNHALEILSREQGNDDETLEEEILRKGLAHARAVNRISLAKRITTRMFIELSNTWNELMETLDRSFDIDIEGEA